MKTTLAYHDTNVYKINTDYKKNTSIINSVNRTTVKNVSFNGLKLREREISLIQQEIPLPQLKKLGIQVYAEFIKKNVPFGKFKANFHNFFENVISEARIENHIPFEIQYGTDYQRIINLSKKLINKVADIIPDNLKLKTSIEEFELSDKSREKLIDILNESSDWHDLITKFICKFYAKPEELEKLSPNIKVVAAPGINLDDADLDFFKNQILSRYKKIAEDEFINKYKKEINIKF